MVEEFAQGSDRWFFVPCDSERAHWVTLSFPGRFNWKFLASFPGHAVVFGGNSGILRAAADSHWNS